MRTFIEVAEDLVLTDALTANHDGTPDHYIVEADNVEYLIRTVLDLLTVDAQPAFDNPDEGHTFRFIHWHRGSSKVVGDKYHSDDRDFTDITSSFEVRAWSLKEALIKAVSDYPFWRLMGHHQPEEEKA